MGGSKNRERNHDLSTNPGIVVCSRTKSERLPNKPLQKVNGIPLIVHTLRRLLATGIPIFLAVPEEDRLIYTQVLREYNDLSKIFIFGSEHVNDPMARLNEVQNKFSLTHVIRVTHDKIFIDLEAIGRALAEARKDPEIEYIFSSTLTPGTGFEIISQRCLSEAVQKYKNVEHVSYAVRLTSKKTFNLKSLRDPFPFHLLIDFPEDLKLIEVIMASLGNNCALPDVINYLRKNPELGLINCPPVVSVYTCAYNSEKFIDRSMASVFIQSDFSKMFEYIIVDDHSTDKTCEHIAKFALGKKNVSWVRNEKNLGLASSSNIALKKARGKYVIRLDADDYFVKDTAILDMLKFAHATKCEAIYPNNYFGGLHKIQKGKDVHHPAGAMFEKRALDSVRFTDGLRNYDGLDLFVRLKDKLKIGYYEKPLFFYTQRSDSMSKTNLEERRRTKEQIEKGII